MSENNLWFFWSNNVKLYRHFALLSDIQVRSADKSKYLNTVLLRPGISYEINESQSTAIGYVFFGTWDEENGKRSFDGEHRIWEQYIIDSKAGRIEVTNRFRLEQRFFQNESNDFAQRFRYYVRAGFPLVHSKEFNRGFFLSIQNEIFLNVQNKENVNNHFLDQNRTYGGLGYRLSKRAELELGYMYRYRVEDASKMNNHIVQLMLSTGF